jgi:hypothetical protein
MRIEREHNRRPPHLPRAGDEPLDNPRVPQVDAVKIANRHSPAAEIGRQIFERTEELHGIKSVSLGQWEASPWQPNLRRYLLKSPRQIIDEVAGDHRDLTQFGRGQVARQSLDVRTEHIGSEGL